MNEKNGGIPHTPLFNECSNYLSVASSGLRLLLQLRARTARPSTPGGDSAAADSRVSGGG